jgi:hypothetical protein
MENLSELEKTESKNVVYVRTVKVQDLPKDVRVQAEGQEILYAVHSSDGEPIALFSERPAAFALARQNDLSPVSVH